MDEPQVVSLGELLIDMIKEGDEPALYGERFLALPGGAPANVAVGLARLGCSVGFIGCVGADKFGDHLASVLEENKVDVTHLKRSAQARTTQAYIYPRPDGKKDIFFYRNPGADQLLNELQVEEGYFNKIKFFNFGSISLIEDSPLNATLKAIKITKKNNGTCFFDPNFRPAIWPSQELAKERIWQGIMEADIVKTSDEDLPFITGEHEVEAGAGRILANSGVSAVIVTLGDKGVYYRTAKGISGSIPGRKVEVVEVTGAGDSFSACLIAGMCKMDKDHKEYEKEDWESLLTKANAAGALATMKKGAIPSLPTEAEISDLLNS